MGEGHSNVSGHGSRGPTGGVKGGPAGRGGRNSNRGSGWGTSDTPYGKLHHYSPSQFGHNQRGGNKGNNRHSQNVSNTPNLVQRPDMQAYMAVGGVPAVITLIEGNWGITLSKLSVVATFVETNLARIASWTMRTSPIGVVVMGMMPSSIAPDPPMGHYFTTPVLPAERVTNTPKEALKAVDDVAVNIRISDVVEAGVQQAVMLKEATPIQRVPVVKAVPTAIPNVYRAPVPGVTPIHINVVESAVPSPVVQPAVAGKPVATPIENAPVKEVTVSSGRHTRDAIIVFPDGTDIEPLYISVIRIISINELREEARSTYEIARSEREVAESHLAQGQLLSSAADRLGLDKALVDSQIAEVAAHIILLEKNLIVLSQEISKVRQRLAFVLSPESRRTFRYVPEMRRLKATETVQQNEINTLNQDIATLSAKQTSLLAKQQRIKVDIEIAERQRVENERLAAEMLERQRVENERLAAEVLERQRVEKERLAAETLERQRVENERLAAEILERQRVENERLIAEEIELALAEERLLVEAEKAAKDLAKRQEVIRQNTYSLPSHPIGSLYSPSFAVIGTNSIVLGQEVMEGLDTSLRMALVKLNAGTSLAVGPMAVTIAAASHMRNKEENSTQQLDWDCLRLAGSIPLSLMGLPSEGSFARADNIELPIRMLITDTDSFSEVHAVKTGVSVVSGKVKQISALYDVAKGAYTFTTDTLPLRTFTFTPAAPPGTDFSPVLPQPASAPVTPWHTGETVIRHTVIHTVFPLPALEEQDFNDYIIWFPAYSGLEPLYVYFKNPRYEPGTVTGYGESISGIWLAGAGKDLGAPIPVHIADQLRGRRFSTFDKFREAFWVAVGHDPELSGQFIVSNRERMKVGKAPKTRKIDSTGQRTSFEIHHVKFIKDGGEVYDIDNSRILTPKRHMEIHSKNRGRR